MEKSDNMPEEMGSLLERRKLWGELRLEVKYAATEMKNAPDWLPSRLTTTEERITELEDRATELPRNTKRLKNKWIRTSSFHLERAWRSSHPSSQQKHCWTNQKSTICVRSLRT